MAYACEGTGVSSGYQEVSPYNPRPLRCMKESTNVSAAPE